MLTSRTHANGSQKSRFVAASAALSHSEWAQQKVQASRAGLTQGSNKLIEQEEWEIIRAAKQRLCDAL